MNNLNIITTYRNRLLIALALVTVLLSQQGANAISYYRDETAFRRGLKLFDFEIHQAGYLQVINNEHGVVRLMNWYSRSDSLKATRTYTYWEDDLSVKRILDMRSDSVIIKELLFGDERTSHEFIRYVYGPTFLTDYRDRFTEVIYDSTSTISAYKFMSTQGELIGAIFLDYDSTGFLISESWFHGPKMNRVREFHYRFHRDTGELEVIERGRGGQVTSHIKITIDPHRPKTDGVGLGIDLEHLMNTSAPDSVARISPAATVDTSRIIP